MADLVCSNCGAAIELKNQFVRTVACEFCGASYLVSGTENLEATGKQASLADFPSRFKVGQTGKLRGRGFQLLGRIRYNYDVGFWEEWQIMWDDGAPPDWIEEDEGYWFLYKRERIKSALPAFDDVAIGSTVQVNQYNVFVTEKRQAQVSGYEGQFASVLPLAGQFSYFQGGANNQMVSVTFWEDEIELSIGDELEFHDIQFDG